MRKVSIKLLLLLGLAMALNSCSNDSAHNAEMGNGVYYWKTTFQLNDYERDFMSKHGIKRIYLRLFDVSLDQDYNMPVPIATTRFVDRVPENVEIVPVVYITTSVLDKICDHDKDLYNRVLAMAKRNGFENIREIQLDCDWTSSTQEQYFDFCKKIKSLASTDSIIISSTIRLHQLKREAPPVDRGVLMLYNTGSIYNPSTTNSILSKNDVKPYLQNTISYPLPLSVAYPTYSWGILLRDSKFMSILHKTDFSDRSLYKLKKGNVYEVTKDHYVENKHLLAGDIIRLEQSGINDISEVQRMVKEKIQHTESVILYHLDSLNLSKFTEQQINNILER